jgi:hypothetical protein
MKFVTGSPFADPDAAVRKLVEIANAIEAVQDGRIHVELINASFLDAGGSPAEYIAPARQLALGLRLTRTCCGTPAASLWPIRATTREPYRPISATETSSTPFDIPSWLPIDSKTFGGERQPSVAIG